MKIKNNTIIGTDPDFMNQQEIIRLMQQNKNMINLPGQTPLNTQMGDDEKD